VIYKGDHIRNGLGGHHHHILHLNEFTYREREHSGP
jgi:hypothetical protein